MIRFLVHTEINKVKWDNCISVAPNGLIYGLSWYLDIVSPNWAALVLDDYKAVMPLPSKRKLGTSYIYIPYLVQQLGVFSIKQRNEVNDFLNHIPKHFRFIEQKLNEGNEVGGTSLEISKNNNFLLEITKDYEEIKKAYSRNCVRNIKKADRVGFKTRHDLSVGEFKDFVRINLDENLAGITDNLYEILQKLIEEAIRRNLGEIVSLHDKEGNIHAAGFYLLSKERLIFSVCASSEYGKQNQAMYKLVDFQIQRYAGKFNYYDFSGSNLKGIAYFNSTFGAFPRTYLTIKMNKLPALLKFLKK